MAATKYHHDNIKRFGIYIIIIEIKLLYILAINIIKTKLSLHKKKFSIKDLFNKCDQIRSKLRIWSHLLKKSLMENFIFCAVYAKVHIFEGNQHTIFSLLYPEFLSRNDYRNFYVETLGGICCKIMSLTERAVPCWSYLLQRMC